MSFETAVKEYICKKYNIFAEKYLVFLSSWRTKGKLHKGSILLWYVKAMPF